jgi:hypothetical protein
MILSSDTHLFRFRGDNINTINELVNNEIWHSKIGGLNDPLDMLFQLDKDALIKLPKDDIVTIIKDTAFFRGKREEIIKCFCSNNLKPIYDYIYRYWGYEFAEGLLVEFQKKVAAACFTKRYDSRLMWGYYGNGMKGICFAYNQEKLKSSDIEFSGVTYSNEAPKINIYKHLLEKRHGNRLTIDGGFALVKHTDWEKEEEVRSLKFLKGDAVYEHLPGLAVPLKGCCIDAVIVGERLIGDMRTFIEKFAAKNDIQVLVAKADFTNYKIQIEPK